MIILIVWPIFPVKYDWKVYFIFFYCFKNPLCLFFCFFTVLGIWKEIYTNRNTYFIESFNVFNKVFIYYIFSFFIISITYSYKNKFCASIFYFLKVDIFLVVWYIYSYFGIFLFIFCFNVIEISDCWFLWFRIIFFFYDIYCEWNRCYVITTIGCFVSNIIRTYLI